MKIDDARWLQSYAYRARADSLRREADGHHDQTRLVLKRVAEQFDLLAQFAICTEASVDGNVVHSVGAEDGLSTEELQTLNEIKLGACGAFSPSHIRRLIEHDYIYETPTGVALAPLGRYRLEVSAREAGLAQLVGRWRFRAEELHAIADTMKPENAAAMRRIAEHWQFLASVTEDLKHVEERSPFLF